MRIHNTAIIRSPTNRPEIGLHTITVGPLSPDYALFQLVDGLERRLAENERMLIYTYSRPQVERLANSWNCAVYHSTLPLQGNTKDYNLDRWDRGETKVMLCTSAFGLGVDRPSVRFVVIYEPALDLLTTAQMLGRAGRDGMPSHAFFVTRDPAISSAKPSRDDQLPKELSEIVHKRVCKVYQLMHHLDGEDFPKTCAEIPEQLPCDVCEPKNPMHQFAMRAVENPHRPRHKLQTYNLAGHQVGLPANPTP
ncbi:P-loop containing nucleoside triphosphate hydrolase protein [Boletus coccyginus]|nr:P-loop containing nucleoside triphosphate hydrolase protein [Boletus coccyginus]